MSDQPPVPPIPPTPSSPPPVGTWTAPAAPPPANPGAGAPSPGNGSDRRWKTWQLLASAGVALMVGLGLGAASADDPDDAGDASERPARAERERDDDRRDEDRSTTTEARRTTTSRPPRTTTTTLPEEGTRENPFPLGTPLVSDSGVQVTVNHVDFDAAAAIAAENMFNDPAPAGMRYALVNLTITNTGDEPIDTGFEIDVSMIGSANRLYDFGNSYCSAVIPNSLNDGGELFTGGTYTGNECLVVPEAEVADGSLLVGVAAGFGDPVFVSSS